MRIKIGYVIVVGFGCALLISLVSCSGQCSYVKRIFSSQCEDLQSSTSFVKLNNCINQITPLPAAASGTAYIAPSLASPAGNSGAWSIGAAPQAGNPVLSNHYSSSSDYVVFLMKDNGSGQVATSSAGTLKHCVDLWAKVGSLTASDVSGILVSAAPCLDVTCTDATGCTSPTPNSSNHVLTNFNPSNTTAYSDNTAVAIASGKYLGCAFIDSYNLASASSLFPPIGVRGLNDGTATPPPWGTGPNSVDSTTNLPVPHSGALLADGTDPNGLAQKANAFTAFTIDASKAAALGSSADSAVTISFATWSDAQSDGSQ